MRLKSLFEASLCWLLTAPLCRAEMKKPGPSSSDGLFDPSKVIQIEIRMDPKDWHKVRVSHRQFEFEEGTMNSKLKSRGYEYARADVKIDGKEVKSVGVRKKGWWGSAASTRPSLKLKLDEYIEGQKFNGIETLTLNNCIMDRTKAEQYLTHSFMAKAGVVTPRANLVRVVVNGEDLGVYGQVESISKDFIKRHFGDAKGNLYESEFGDFTINQLSAFQHKWGDDRDSAELRELTDLLGHPEGVSLEKLEQCVDIDRFLTFWAAEVLSGSPDSYSASNNNFFLYRDYTSGKFHFIPWGRDVGFKDRRPAPKSVRAAGVLCKRLWDIASVRERYRREMRRLLDTVWDENEILASLDRVKSLCEPFYTVKPNPNHFEELTQFVKHRRAEIEVELNFPATDLPKAVPWISKPPVKGPLMEITGSFAAPVLATMPKDLFGQGSASMRKIIDNKTNQPFSCFGAVAVPNQGEPEYTMLEIVAMNEDGTLRWKFHFDIDPHLTAPGKVDLAPVALWGNLVQEDLRDPKASTAQRRGVMSGQALLRGTVTFEKADRAVGSTIAGTFHLTTTAFEQENRP